MEDPDNDGLNRTGLIAKYCPSYEDPQSSNCHIDPDTPDGKLFYDNLENTQASKNLSMERIQLEMILMEMNGMTDLKCITKTMTMMAWPQVGSITSISTHTTMQTAW